MQEQTSMKIQGLTVGDRKVYQHIFDTFYPGGKTYLLKEFFIQAICIKQKDKNHATIDSELYREVRCLGHGFNTWVSVVK